MKRISICILILGVITSQVWAKSVEKDDEEEDSDSNEAFQPEPQVIQSNVHQSISNGGGQPGNFFFSSQSYGPNGNNKAFIKVSNPWITYDGNIFNCSGHSCPNGTFKCEVFSETDASNKVNLNSVAKCFDQSGVLLESKNFVESNPYPHAEKSYSRTGFVTATGEVVLKDSNGYLNHISGNGGTTLTKEEQDEIRDRHAQITHSVNQQIAEQQRRLQEYFAELQRNIFNGFQGDFWRPQSAYPFSSYNPYFPFYQPAFQPFSFFPPSFPFYNPANYYPTRSTYQSGPPAPNSPPPPPPSGPYNGAYQGPPASNPLPPPPPSGPYNGAYQGPPVTNPLPPPPPSVPYNGPYQGPPASNSPPPPPPSGPYNGPYQELSASNPTPPSVPYNGPYQGPPASNPPPPSGLARNFLPPQGPYQYQVPNYHPY